MSRTERGIWYWNAGSSCGRRNPCSPFCCSPGSGEVWRSPICMTRKQSWWTEADAAGTGCGGIFLCGA